MVYLVIAAPASRYPTTFFCSSEAEASVVCEAWQEILLEVETHGFPNRDSATNYLIERYPEL